MDEEFTTEDFINMADDVEERVKTMFLRIVVKKEDYKKLAQAIVDSGVEIEWNVLKVYTKVSPLAGNMEFET